MGAPAVETLTLTTSDAIALEAELVVPEDTWAAVLLCHPHPTAGGSMRSMVTGHQFRELPTRGLACLRFNFRGVERSQGSHGGGGPERLDVVAGLDALHPIIEGLPLVVAGWSFGADTSLTVVDERIAGWCATAPPLRTFSAEEFLAGPDARPKVLIVPEHDQFCPPDRLAPKVSTWASTEVVVAPGADHFMVGRLDDAVTHVEALATRLASGVNYRFSDPSSMPITSTLGDVSPLGVHTERRGQEPQMGLLARIHNLRRGGVPPREPVHVFGSPVKCPSCGGRGYLDQVDLASRVQYEHCTACGEQWVLTEDEINAMG